jgi:hypothetical protein
MKYFACKIHPMATLSGMAITMPQYAKETIGGIPGTKYEIASCEDEHWGHLLSAEEWDILEMTEDEKDNAKWYSNERGWNPTDYDEYVSLGTNADLTLSSQYKEMLPEAGLPHVISLMKKVKCREIENWYRKSFDKLNVQKSNQEQITWQQQYQEAQDYTNDSTAVTPILTKLAEIRGSDVATVAAKVIEKRNEWHTSIANIVGAMQKERDQIKAETTIAGLNALDSDRTTPAGFHSGLLVNA